MNPEEIQSKLSQLKGWELVLSPQAFIKKTYVFSSYNDGLKLINSVAEYAEKINHHPDMTLGFKKVSISWTTHDMGGLDDKDFEAAKVCDQMIKNLNLA
jgi:4a-hydroxytetrahydrobiopterin dehydratase